MEQNSHIKAQKRVSDDNPNICPDEEANKPSIESFNSVKPDVICSKAEAAEEEHMVDHEIKQKKLMMSKKVNGRFRASKYGINHQC